MNRLLSIAALALVAAFIACEEGTPTDEGNVPAIGPCQDYTCDSLVMRYILDVNGFDTVAVEDVSDTAGGRIDFFGSFWDPMDWTVLPPQIGNLVSLTGMAFVGGQLTSLPPEIGNLDSLRDLILWDNNLTVLPPEMGNLVSLEWLGLFGNNLTTLPAQIGSLVSLLELDVEDNGLTRLPPEIGNLVSLE